MEIPEPKGELVLTVELQESSFTGIPEGKHGYYLYVYDPGAFTKGPLVTVYRYDNGKIVDVFGGGSSGSAWFIDQLEGLGVETFDYDLAMEAAVTLEAAQGSEVEESEVESPVGMNDGIYRIAYAYEGAAFQFSEENPGPLLRHYANYNHDISKLSELVNLLGTYYGLMKIGM